MRRSINRSLLKVCEMTKTEQYQSALNAWINLRRQDEVGWGEEHDPNAEIKGWRDDLDIEAKTTLLKQQFKEDLQIMLAYDEWENR